MTVKPSCWESAASGLGQANILLLCTCTRRGQGEQDHLGREVTEEVLRQVVLATQSRAPSPPQGSKHLPSPQVFFKARRGTVHPKFINMQQSSVSLKPSPTICSSHICKLLSIKLTSRGLSCTHTKLGLPNPAEEGLFSNRMCEIRERMPGTRAAACSAPKVRHTAAGAATAFRAGSHKGNEEWRKSQHFGMERSICSLS